MKDMMSSEDVINSYVEEKYKIELTILRNILQTIEPEETENDFTDTVLVYEKGFNIDSELMEDYLKRLIYMDKEDAESVEVGDMNGIPNYYVCEIIRRYMHNKGYRVGVDIEYDINDTPHYNFWISCTYGEE